MELHGIYYDIHIYRERDRYTYIYITSNLIFQDTLYLEDYPTNRSWMIRTADLPTIASYDPWDDAPEYGSVHLLGVYK